MAKFHFVEDYEALVKHLIATKPLDEAMSIAVGGQYHYYGEIEKDILLFAGLKDGMVLVDYGCGSGRLANTLGKTNLNITYVGIDIIEDFLKYAATQSPPNYTFWKHQELYVPIEPNRVDMICAFSLFTHLLHAETYIYLVDMYRVLKQGGRLVFSFLDFNIPSHWNIFMDTVSATRTDTLPHLNMFLEKSIIQLWAKRIGFRVIELIDGDISCFNGKPLGQSLAILEK